MQKKISILITFSVIIFNLMYEISSKKTTPQNNLGVKQSRIRKLMNKFNRSRKFRLLLSTGVILFSFGVSSLDPKVPNFTRHPITLVCSNDNQNLEEVQFLNFIDFISNEKFVDTNRRIREIIIDNEMDRGAKIILLSYQFDGVFRILGREQSPIFLAQIMKALITGAIPGYYGLNCIFKAIHKLYDEGKISTELYDLLIEILREMIKTTQAKPVNIEELTKREEIVKVEPVTLGSG